MNPRVGQVSLGYTFKEKEKESPRFLDGNGYFQCTKAHKLMPQGYKISLISITIIALISGPVKHETLCPNMRWSCPKPNSSMYLLQGIT
jgi:hypothetical protein